MRKTKLSSSEILDLINRYQSELKKLEFQTEEVTSIISDLKKWLESVENIEKTVLLKHSRRKKSVSPAKPAATDTKKRKSPPKKNEKKKTDKTPVLTKSKTKTRKAGKGYKLSDWDNWVISSVSEKGSALITQEIIDFVKRKAQEKKLGSTDEEIKNKVIRSLQKLVRRRSDLIKVPYKGRGYAYALPGVPVLNSKTGRKKQKK